MRENRSKTKIPIVTKCIFWEPSRPHWPLDQEHIFGKWLRQYVRSDLNKHRLRVETIGQPGTLHLTETTLRAGEPLLSKPKIVCKECNSGWMSLIQENAKPFLIPLIQGHRTMISIEAQKEIASWCAMATITGEYLARDATVAAISQWERDWFRDHRTPPKNWKIWIGYYPGSKGTFRHYAARILNAENFPRVTNDALYRPNTQTTTFVIGKLFVHAMSSTGNPDFVSRWVWPAPIGIRLLQIFPRRESLVAWPPNGFTDFEIKRIDGALAKIIDAASRGRSNIIV
jgi:hypothetical protein